MLLHPLQSMPVRSWTFDNQPVIKIGRCSDNDVVLYSSVVSRYHAELRLSHRDWEIINLGSNGTYLDGQPITKVTVVSGLIINVARSGPKIGIYLHHPSEVFNIKTKKNYHQHKGLDNLGLFKEDEQQESFEDTKLE